MRLPSCLPIVKLAEKVAPLFGDDIFTRKLACYSINGYQYFISPYKGFSCAHAYFHNGLGCSEYGKTAIEEYGLEKGLQMLLKRLYECHKAFMIIKEQKIHGYFQEADCGQIAQDTANVMNDSIRLERDTEKLERDLGGC